MIKKVRRSMLKKFHIDLEKEEEWLTSMCNKGYALSEISNGYYYFETCIPGEYIYHIEFLNQKTSSHYEKSAYIDFIKEMEIDHIASINRWQYFRRNASLGNFEIYSDVSSKIDHYSRINGIWYILSIIFIAPVFYDITDLFLNNFKEINKFSILFNLVFLFIGLLLIKKAIPLSKKIRNLKKEQQIHD